MKKTSLAPYAGLLAAFLLPLFAQRLSPPREYEPAAAYTSPEPPAASAAPLSAPPGGVETVRVKTEDGVVDIDMQEYLIGVVASEMPASFHPQALKAQAVAARTYALYCAKSGRHADAQICTDYACCQAWSSEQQLRELWGADYERCRQNIADAVDQTRGQHLQYDGEPVFAAFHSSSAGATEDCGSVWNPRPYLVSVDSPETAADVPNYESTVSCLPLDFRDTVLYAFPNADFTGPEEEWIGSCVRDGSGRVAALTLGGTEIAGTTLRSLFKLRSTAFSLAYSGGVFVFSVTGYGHGVGMSQYGANVMAQNGADYTQILAHYYQGTTLVD